MALYSYKCPHNSGRNSLECEIQLYKTSVRQLKPLATSSGNIGTMAALILPTNYYYIKLHKLLAENI